MPKSKEEQEEPKREKKQFNYVYHLYVEDQCVDTTSLDEPDEELAFELFMGDFGWRKKTNPHQNVAVVEGEITVGDHCGDIYDDPDNFKLSSEVHPKGLKICTCSSKNKREMKKLQSCPKFKLEDEGEENMKAGSNMTCAYCWGQGWYSVCEREDQLNAIIDE